MTTDEATSRPQFGARFLTSGMYGLVKLRMIMRASLILLLQIVMCFNTMPGTMWSGTRSRRGRRRRPSTRRRPTKWTPAPRRCTRRRPPSTGTSSTPSTKIGSSKKEIGCLQSFQILHPGIRGLLEYSRMKRTVTNNVIKLDLQTILLVINQVIQSTRQTLIISEQVNLTLVKNQISDYWRLAVELDQQVEEFYFRKRAN